LNIARLFTAALIVVAAQTSNASAKTTEAVKSSPDENSWSLFSEAFGRAPRYSFGLENQYTESMRLGFAASIESFRYGDVRFYNLIVPIYNWFEIHKVEHHSFFVSPGFNFLISQTRYPKRTFTTWGSVGHFGGGYEFTFDSGLSVRGTAYLPLVMGVNLWGGLGVGYRL